MPERLIFKLLPRNQHSNYDWLNIDCGAARIGKVRGLIDGRTLTIYSINIFSEFEGHGYGRKTIETFKESFDAIIADRVRYTAIGFWVKMGFTDAGDGSYVYQKK